MCMLHARRLAGDSVCIRYTSPLWQLRVWWRRQVKRQAITRKCFLIFLLTPQLTPQLVFPLFHKFQVHPSLSCDPCFLAVFVDTGVQYSFREKALKSHSGSAEALKSSFMWTTLVTSKAEGNLRTKSHLPPKLLALSWMTSQKLPALG